jgi:hypothetical protein
MLADPLKGVGMKVRCSSLIDIGIVPTLLINHSKRFGHEIAERACCASDMTPLCCG